MTALVLRHAVQATAALLTVLSEGATPTAFRAAALLGKALERLGRGLWPLTDDVRAFLLACVQTIAAEAGTSTEGDAGNDAVHPEDAEETTAVPTEPFFLVTVDESDLLVDDGSVEPPPWKTDAPAGGAPAEKGCAPAQSSGGVAQGGGADVHGASGRSAALAVTADQSDYSSDCLAALGVFTLTAEQLAAYKAQIHDLCFRGAPKAAEILVGILHSDVHYELRALAAAYLGALRPPDAAETLAVTLCDASAAVRSAALGALVRFGGEVARLAVAHAATDEDAWVRFEAQLWATKLARAPVAHCCPMLSSTGFCDRPGVCAAPDCDWETAGRGDFRACPRWRTE